MSKSQSTVFDTIRSRFHGILEEYMTSLQPPSATLYDAMKYATLNYGKSLRPLLIYTTGELLNCETKKLDAPALAVELLHCYSLVHDDLPAMDDDDLRRGQPSCHKAYDEATAILVGDALQSLSIQVLMDAPELNPEQKVNMAKTLLKASGLKGMVAGQALDLAYLNEKETDEKTLHTIHQLKTGKLFTACVLMACHATSLPKTDPLYQALYTYATELGVAFQIQDDYLDEYGETNRLGKLKGSDTKQGKLTYTHFYDQSSLENLIETRYQKAIDAIMPYAEKATSLLTLTQALQNRDH